MGKAVLTSRHIEARRLEADSVDSSKGKRYDCVIIQEGLGNFGDAFYYSSQALESGVQAFEGAQCYINHPSKIDEASLPERTVRDLCGHYENVRVEKDSDERSVLRGELVLLEGAEFDWVRSMFNHGIDYSEKYPDEVFVGLSINASGDADPVSIDELLKSKDVPEICKRKLTDAKSLGVSEVRMTKTIHEAVSCDVVTQPGAGGRVLKLLESERTKAMSKITNKSSKREADAPHADEEQDVKLIKSMLDKYMGAGSHGEEEAKEAKQAMQAYEDMGEKKEDAMAMAAKHIAAKHKMSAKQDESKDDKKVPGHDDAKADGKEPPAPDAEKEDESHKQGDESKKEKKESETIAKLTGRIALLERERDEHKYRAHVGAKLTEAKLSKKDAESVSKLLEGVKDIATADKLIAAFCEGAKGKPVENIYESPEAPLYFNESDNKGDISFADCLAN